MLMRALAGVVTMLAAIAPAAAHAPDPHRLPLGDALLSAEPERGHIWACRIDPDAGGADRDGPWIDAAAGTFDITRKPAVAGRVAWTPRFTILVRGDLRLFETNDLPSHPTGTFPIPASDPIYLYDRNPNRIRAQRMSLALPATPQPLARPQCAPGAVGILLTGAVLFSALDGPGRDAVAHEAQDGCQGHPQQGGVYHYHSVTPCLDVRRLPDGHSGLVGYALDGFGIFGRTGSGGQELGSEDLDACHGHVHAIPWDGRMVVMYHYHATLDFPYTVGCMRGAVDRETVRMVSGPPPSRGFGAAPPPPGGGRGGADLGLDLLLPGPPPQP
jgi:hypothetical protein